jgi:hypothetical protein
MAGGMAGGDAASVRYASFAPPAGTAMIVELMELTESLARLAAQYARRSRTGRQRSHSFPVVVGDTEPTCASGLISRVNCGNCG